MTKKKSIGTFGYLVCAFVYMSVQPSFAGTTTIGLTIIDSGATTTGSTTTGSTHTGGAIGVVTGETYLFAGGSAGPMETHIVFSGGVSLTPQTGEQTKTSDPELDAAFLWAKEYGITRASTRELARLYSPITRAELAKMIVQYVTQVKELPIAPLAICDSTVYQDNAGMDDEQKYFVQQACSLGVMGRKNNKKETLGVFRPHDFITRAEFGTVLSRYLYGDTYNGNMQENERYAGHLQALQKAKYMKFIHTPFARELRGFVLLILYRIG